MLAPRSNEELTRDVDTLYDYHRSVQSQLTELQLWKARFTGFITACGIMASLPGALRVMEIVQGK